MRRAIMICLALSFGISICFGSQILPPDQLPAMSSFRMPSDVPMSEHDWAPATYLSFMSITDFCWNSGGRVFAMIGATAPLGVDDTTFSGTVEFEILEEIDNGSVAVYNGMMPDVPITEINLVNGQAFVMIDNTDIEFIGIKIKDPSGELRSSQAFGIDFIEGGEYAINAKIDGSTIFSPTFGGAGPFVWSMFLIDDSGQPVTQAVDSFVIWIENEEIDDSSASISSLFDEVASRRINSMVLGGRTYFSFIDPQYENVTLSCAAYYGDLIWEIDEPFVLSSVDSGRALNIIGFPSTGPIATVGREFSLAAMSFVPGSNSPDFTNNTTEVKLEIHDIIGPESSIHNPTGWQTLVSGVFGFGITDSEADSFGIFMDIDVRGEPPLFSFLSIPVSIKAPESAKNLHVLSPTVAFSGDTVSAYVQVINSYGENVDSYHGYFGLGVYGEFRIPPAPTITIGGMAYSAEASDEHYEETSDGALEFKIQYDFTETLTVKAFDAEIGMYYDQGYIGESIENEIAYIEGSYDAPYIYDICPPNEGFLETGREYMVSVVALTEEGIPKRDHSGTASIEVSGSASLSTDEIVFINGVANFIIYDLESETVEVHVWGGFPDEITEELRFLAPGEPGAAYIPTDEFIVYAGDEVELPVIAWGPGGFITSFDGIVHFNVEEPDMDASAEYLESAILTAGIGSFGIINTDAEIVSITATSDSLEDGAYDMPFYCRLTMDEPDTSFATGCGAEVAFICYDGPWVEIVDYNGLFNIEIIEQNPNESCEFDTFVVLEDGAGLLLLSNTEQETVWVDVNIPNGELLIPECTETEDGCIIGHIFFESHSVTESRPSELSFSDFMPNPFNTETIGFLNVENAINAEIELIDLAGRTVLHKQQILVKGANEIRLNASNLESGIYFYRIIQNDYIFKGRILYVR